MLLTVDIGNTNIKVGAWDGGELIFVSSMRTDIRSTPDEYAIKLLDVFRMRDYNSSQFDGAILASVVPPLSGIMTRAVKTVLQIDRVYLADAAMSGMKIAIDNPAQLGADLVCAAAAVVSKTPLPCLFVNLGTATTVFAIDGDGCISGGAISPGIGISLEALSTKTAQLPHISLEDPGSLIGKNTVDSMKSGVVYGTSAMLDGLVGRFREELSGGLSTDICVVASGGFARSIIPHCREKITIDDNIVLEGLKIIYERINHK